MTLKIDPKNFKFNLNNSYLKLIGKAEIIRDIIKSLSKNDIVQNKKELLLFAQNLEKIIDNLENQNTKEAKELLNILDEIIETIIEPLEDEWIVSEIKTAKNDETIISVEEVLKELR